MQDPKREAEEIVAEHARVGMNADRFRALIGAIEESLVNARSRGRAEGLREAMAIVRSTHDCGDHCIGEDCATLHRTLTAISALLGEKPDRDAK